MLKTHPLKVTLVNAAYDPILGNGQVMVGFYPKNNIKNFYYPLHFQKGSTPGTISVNGRFNPRNAPKYITDIVSRWNGPEGILRQFCVQMDNALTQAVPPIARLARWNFALYSKGGGKNNEFEFDRCSVNLVYFMSSLPRESIMYAWELDRKGKASKQTKYFSMHPFNSKNYTSISNNEVDKWQSAFIKNQTKMSPVDILEKIQLKAKSEFIAELIIATRSAIKIGPNTVAAFCRLNDQMQFDLRSR